MRVCAVVATYAGGAARGCRARGTARVVLGRGAGRVAQRGRCRAGVPGRRCRRAGAGRCRRASGVAGERGQVFALALAASLSAAWRNSSRGVDKLPSATASRRNNSAIVQSKTMRTLRFSVGIADR